MKYLHLVAVICLFFAVGGLPCMAAGSGGEAGPAFDDDVPDGASVKITIELFEHPGRNQPRVRAILGSSAVQALDLHYDSSRALSDLTGVLRLSSLQSLDLSYMNLGSQGMRMFLRILSEGGLSRLTTLNLMSDKLVSHDVEGLAAELLKRRTRGMTLILSQNKLASFPLSLISCVKEGIFKLLDISHNEIDDDSIPRLCENLLLLPEELDQRRTLGHIDLSWNMLTDRMVLPLLRLAEGYGEGLSLDLSRNCFRVAVGEYGVGVSSVDELGSYALLVGCPFAGTRTLESFSGDSTFNSVGDETYTLTLYPHFDALRDAMQTFRVISGEHEQPHSLDNDIPSASDEDGQLVDMPDCSDSLSGGSSSPLSILHEPIKITVLDDMSISCTILGKKEAERLANACERVAFTTLTFKNCFISDIAMKVLRPFMYRITTIRFSNVVLQTQLGLSTFAQTLNESRVCGVTLKHFWVGEGKVPRDSFEALLAHPQGRLTCKARKSDTLFSITHPGGRGEKLSFKGWGLSARQMRLFIEQLKGRLTSETPLRMDVTFALDTTHGEGRELEDLRALAQQQIATGDCLSIFFPYSVFVSSSFTGSDEGEIKVSVQEPS